MHNEILNKLNILNEEDGINNVISYLDAYDVIMSASKDNPLENYDIALLVIEKDNQTSMYKDFLLSLLPKLYYNKEFWCNDIRKKLKNQFLREWASSENVKTESIFNWLVFSSDVNILDELLKNPFLDSNSKIIVESFRNFECHSQGISNIYPLVPKIS